MSENQEIKISLSQLIKIETALGSFSEKFELSLIENKKSLDEANKITEMLSQIRKDHDLEPEDGY